MKQKMCHNCGSQMKWNDKTYRYECPYCGTVLTINKMEAKSDGSECGQQEALVQYIEQRLEAKEFSLALSGCEQLLRMAPQMGYVHALRCCANRHAQNVKQLATIPLAMERDSDFCNALRYSSGDMLQLLQTVAQQSKELAEKKLRPIQDQMAPLKKRVSEAQAKLEVLEKENETAEMEKRMRFRQNLHVFLRIFVAVIVTGFMADAGFLAWIPILFILWQLLLIVKIMWNGKKELVAAPIRATSIERCRKTIENDGRELKKLEAQLDSMLREQMMYVLS